jgi:excisionase family DNA binding protein
MRDPYQVLGVGPRSTRDEIRAAYRRLARRWHPDLHASSSQAKRREAELRMKELNAAYDAIGSGKVARPAPQWTRDWDPGLFRQQGPVYQTERGPGFFESLRELVDVLAGRQSPPMSVEQVAARLRVHPITVYRMIERGLLRAVRVSGLWRVSGEALAAYLFGYDTRRPPASREA